MNNIAILTLTLTVSIFVSLCFVTSANEKAVREQTITANLAALEQVKFTAAEKTEIDRFCAKFGSDVNAKDEKGESLLHKAVDTTWSLAVVQFLILQGADLEARDKVRKTPLHKAVGEKNTNRALGAKHLEIVKLLVSVGANVNAQASGGFTPLHLAASNVNVDITKLLVANGADVNATVGTSKYIKRRPQDLAKEANNASVVAYYSGRKEAAKADFDRITERAAEAERARIPAEAMGLATEKKAQMQWEVEMEKARNPAPQKIVIVE